MPEGLSSEEAKRILQESGPNLLNTDKPRRIWAILKDIIREPMFLLLLGCGSLYMFVGDYREGGILLSWILVIIGLTFYQSKKTERALDALKNLSSPRAMVWRDGKLQRIPGADVVPGDMLVLNEGDRVAADAVLAEINSVTIDESMLSGESVPVHKNQPGEPVYQGTLVVRGQVLASVTATGMQSRIGQIASLIKKEAPAETRMQKEMKKLIRRLAIGGIIVSVLVVLLFYVSRGNFIESLLIGLSSAMSVLPEEFPVVLTVFLALGALRLSKKKVLTRKPSAIETLGSATVLCSDKTGTITLNKMQIAGVIYENKILGIEALKSPEIHGLLQHAQSACRANSFDPLDLAILQSGHINDTEPNGKLIKAYEFSHQLMAVSMVYEDEHGGVFFASKGAPETIFELCKLGETEKIIQQNLAEKFAAEGFRMIAVASGKLTETPPENQELLPFRYEGMIAFQDPVRPEVPAAVQACKDAGIRVIMITGDYPVTADKIARDAGFEKSAILTGEALDKLSDPELSIKLKEINVFARVVPEQKLRIIKALRANDEVIIMTGDGVNDAPALKAADIGIAMGNKGTDVARESAAIVLMDDNFASIVAAIRQGRRIYDNLQKAMSYIMAIHIPIIGLALLPALFPQFPVILLPMHIVFLELIIDPVCSIAFESEREEKWIMKRKPRSASASFFGGSFMLYSIFKGLLLLALVIVVFLLTLQEGHTESEVRAIAFTTLITGNIFLIMTDISRTRNFLAVLFSGNIAAAGILVAAAGLMFISVSVPFLLKIFMFHNPGYSHFLPAIAGSLFMLTVLECIKYFKFRILNENDHFQNGNRS